MKRQIDEKFEPTAGELEAMLTGDSTALDNERTTAARKGKVKKRFVVESRFKSHPSDAEEQDTWRQWSHRRYATAKQRNDALNTLRKSHQNYEFRGVDE